MLTIPSTLQLGLLRNLSTSRSNISTALERISTGSRINSAADDPAGLVVSNGLRTQIGGISAQLANAVRLNSKISTASNAVGEQISLLQEARSLAVSAASGTATAADRTNFQTSLNGVVSDINLIATTTSFNGQTLLDGSIGQQNFSLGGLGSSSIAADFANTQTSSLGHVAETIGTSVTTTPLAAGDLVINGVSISATAAGDDTLSTANNDASAIATAAAINRADAGVTATVQATTVNLGTIASGSFAAGELTLNGVDIGAVTVQAGDADSALANAINAITSSTGVTAALNSSNELVLTAADGRNIATGGTNTSGGGVVSSDPGTATHTGSVVLTSSSDITIAGTTPGSAGLAAGTTTVATGSSIANLDISNQAGAERAVRQIDEAIAELSSLQSSLGASSTRLDNVSSYLTSTQTTLNSALEQIAGADIAAETAALSASSFSAQTQIALLAQANVQNGFVLDLLLGLNTSTR